MKTKTKCVTSAKAGLLKKSTSINNGTNDFITIVILCDSEPYRMKSYGPISLLDINGEKLIDIQISYIKKFFKNNEIIICAGNSADKIHKYIKCKHKNLNIRIVENQNFNNSNSVESLRICLNNTLNNKILIFSGDLIINDCLSLIDYKKNSIIIESNPCENLDIGVNIDENNKANYFSYGASKIWSEIIYFNGDDSIECLRKCISTNYNKNKFIFEILNDIIKIKNITCAINNNQIQKIKNIKAYHNVKN